MSDQPLFSVVIPAYNRAHCIDRALESVLEQTEQCFEIIVVDDGSKDGTEHLMRELCQKETRLRYIKQTNGGASKARNTGIKAAKGKYIAFLDSDDVFLPFHLQQALSVLESGKEVCTYAQVIVERGSGVNIVKPTRGIKENEHVSEYLLKNRGFVPTITLIIPANLAKSVLYDEHLGWGDDADFALRLAVNGGQLRMLAKPSAIWEDLWSENRLSSTIDPVKRLEWLDRAKKYMTRKAYHAVLGRSIAKGYAQRGNKLKGLSLYFKALVNGGFNLKTAIIYFFQISLSTKQYRKFSDFLARLGFKP